MISHKVLESDYWIHKIGEVRKKLKKYFYQNFILYSRKWTLQTLNLGRIIKQKDSL